ncbi:hypothetical protein [uncultured Cohaesibacter sp.]|uniref:hypothetical protein n=1 Tax=uncultured Cohaesibacter sp. TaxID=1002546 RepID=UPI0029C92210|nr:hypothetical protein [uncultured Cohaesibacter sp.]
MSASLRRRLLSSCLPAGRGALLNCALPKHDRTCVGPAITSLGSARPSIRKPCADVSGAIDAREVCLDFVSQTLAEISQRFREWIAFSLDPDFHDFCSSVASSTSLQDWSAAVSEKGEENFS